MRNQCADEETWLQEFLCVPGDDNAAFLAYDLIASCEYPPGQEWEMDVAAVCDRRQSPAVTDRRYTPTGESKSDPPSEMGGAGDPPAPSRDSREAAHLYLGVDVGRDHDLTVIWVVESVEDVCFTRDVICLDKQTFAEQEDVLYRFLALRRVRRACIDQTGLGRQFAERAIAKFGKYKIEGVTFTSAVKEDLAYATRTAFEKKTVRIPADKWIRADLRSLRKEATASGNIRFTGERNRHGHADRFWALALALHAARQSGPVNTIFAQVI